MTYGAILSAGHRIEIIENRPTDTPAITSSKITPPSTGDENLIDEPRDEPGAQSGRRVLHADVFRSFKLHAFDHWSPSNYAAGVGYAGMVGGCCGELCRHAYMSIQDQEHGTEGREVRKE
jgi:hypothetical protein